MPFKDESQKAADQMRQEPDVWLLSEKQGGKMMYTLRTRDIGLINKMMAASKMLDALEDAHHMLTRDFIDPAKRAVIEKCDEIIAQAKGKEI